MYKLRVKVGHSYDPSTHIHIVPNDDQRPVYIDTPHFTGRICVRVRDFNGFAPEGKERIAYSRYFDGNSDQYSIQVQGRFKGSWTGDDVVFGNDFDHKIELPPLSWLGLKILQIIDPALEADIYGDKPWAYSPILVTMNTIRVSEAPIELDKDDSSRDRVLPSWPSSDGSHVKEGELVSFDPTKRRKYFSKKERRVEFQIKESQVWDIDFFNSYADFNNFAVKLPGFSISLAPFWKRQPLPFRYVCKTRDSSAVFFVVIFDVTYIEDVNDNKSGKGDKNQDLQMENIETDDSLKPLPDSIENNNHHQELVSENSNKDSQELFKTTQQTQSPKSTATKTNIFQRGTRGLSSIFRSNSQPTAIDAAQSNTNILSTSSSSSPKESVLESKENNDTKQQKSENPKDEK
ncbi:4888_t:CDS:2, partial [Ambispora leptoticha]